MGDKITRGEWLVVVDKAIDIWTDRANGIHNSSGCPMCEILDKRCGDDSDCHECILSSNNNESCLLDCFDTPYGYYDYIRGELLASRDHDSKWYLNKDVKNAADQMVKMLESYKNGNMDLFTKYLNFMSGIELTEFGKSCIESYNIIKA